MTYPQFKNAVEAIARKINWEMKLSIATVNQEGFKESDFPLFGGSAHVDENRVMTMNDAIAIKALATS